MKLGIDIVHIPEFEKLMQDRGFIKRVFHESELKDYRAEHLAGIFAAKEAFFKAINQKPQQSIKNLRSGSLKNR